MIPLGWECAGWNFICLLWLRVAPLSEWGLSFFPTLRVGTGINPDLSTQQRLPTSLEEREFAPLGEWGYPIQKHGTPLGEWGYPIQKHGTPLGELEKELMFAEDGWVPGGLAWSAGGFLRRASRSSGGSGWPPKRHATEPAEPRQSFSALQRFHPLMFSPSLP